MSSRRRSSAEVESAQTTLDKWPNLGLAGSKRLPFDLPYGTTANGSIPNLTSCRIDRTWSILGGRSWVSLAWFRFAQAGQGDQTGLWP
jgi:hypothetical protein